MATHTLTQADDGTTVTVQKGDEIIIQLPENPTTGYQWEANPFDESRVRLVRSVFAPAGHAAPGAGGIHTFTMIAQDTGIISIAFKNWRVWEGSGSIRSQFSVTIRVEQ